MPPKQKTLGSEIRRLRTDAGITLRAFAEAIEISAAHMSDIEHDRRRPSEAVLRRIAKKLRADFDEFEKLNTRVDPETQEWVADNPGVAQMLRTMRQDDRPVSDLLKAVEEALKRRGGRS